MPTRGQIQTIRRARAYRPLAGVLWALAQTLERRELSRNTVSTLCHDVVRPWTVLALSPVGHAPFARGKALPTDRKVLPSPDRSVVSPHSLGLTLERGFTPLDPIIILEGDLHG